MVVLREQLEMERCPHCSVARPVLNKVFEQVTKNHSGHNQRSWRVYKCSSCGGLVTACAQNYNLAVRTVFPEPIAVEEEIPERPRAYLQQAIDSVFTPAGSIMLCASSVDAMLKLKGYKDGSLYKRIEKASTDGLITAEMSKWAHEVRLDANDQRHADENADLPSENDAKKAIDFVKALAQFLFVLPAHVKRGLEEAAK
jgi:hypothetical protein